VTSVLRRDLAFAISIANRQNVPRGVWDSHNQLSGTLDYEMLSSLGNLSMIVL